MQTHTNDNYAFSSRSQLREALFNHVIDALGVHKNLAETVPRILEESCEVFQFICGFIYEADHTGTLLLKEHTNATASVCLPTEIPTRNVLDSEDREIIKSGFLSANDECGGHPELNQCIRNLFGGAAYLLVPILDDSNTLIGCCGALQDEDAKNQEGDLSVVRSVFMVIANHVKIRIYQNQITYSKESLAATLDNTGVDIYVTDYHTHEILYVNHSMAAPYGGIANFENKKCYEALYNNQTEPCVYCPRDKLTDENGNPTKVYSWDYQRPFDQSWFRVISTAFKWVDGRLAHAISSVDISESKKYQFLMEEMAFLDPLTGIPNRRCFDRDFEYIFSNTPMDDISGYLLFIDLDNFKQINDVYGHDMGDELLKQVSNYLNSLDSANGNSYRYGGDEFIILLNDVDYDGVTSLLKEMKRRFRQPWHLSNLDYLCSGSIGIVHFPSDGTDSSSLIHKADSAMYLAKEKGKDRAEFYKD